jgi:hypothetical protein
MRRATTTRMLKIATKPIECGSDFSRDGPHDGRFEAMKAQAKHRG